MVRFDFKIGEKDFNIDVNICNNILNQANGLMFRRKSKPLLFIFKTKKRRVIHSFFCVPFITIWFDGDNIIEIRKVMPWKLSVKPRKKFDKLLEIPRNSIYFDEFVVDKRNI